MLGQTWHATSEVQPKKKTMAGDECLITGLLDCVSIAYRAGNWVIPAGRMVKIDKI